jgi:signal transduction histidine kinase
LRDSLRITDEVVGILGHDLRNPLHAIALTTENLIAEPGCEPWLRSLVRIRNGAERMARLIDQLLDLAKARLGGGLQVEPVAMDLADLVRAQIEESQPSAEQTIEIEVRGDTTGLWDRDRLAQAITNLLDNAIHHGHPDTPIQVELDGTSGEVLLSVWNGGAIAADLLPVVFEPFRGRRDGGSRRGLGLGLYIAREVVSAHGGVLTVRSSLLSGTTFLLALPRQRPAGS